MAQICVFCKPPVPGQVKTRLAAALGPEVAARLAEAFLADTLLELRRLPHLIALATTRPEFPLDAPESRWDQGDGDLGARIARVLARALLRAPYAVAIGADSPGLPAERVDEAIRALDRVDAALIPAADGGFVLLAVRRLPADALTDLPWSTPATCTATVARLCALGLSVEVLTPWFDVDRPADLDRLRREVDPARAPHTFAVLASLGAR